MDVTEKLFDAVERDDLEKVKMFVESETVSLGTISRGYAHEKETLAHVAARRGNLDMLKYLLEKDSSLIKNTSNEGYLHYDQGFTLLETAVKYGHLDIVKYLVEGHNYGIFTRRPVLLGSSSLNPVILSIAKCRLDILKYFIEERHVDVETGGPQRDGRNEISHFDFEPVLFTATRMQCPNITRYLIDERNASLTVLGENKKNILYNAVLKNNLDLIKYVLDVKKATIDINWRNADGKTLVHFAVKHDFAILKYLVEQKKADVNIPSYGEKMTPLHSSIYGISTGPFEFLVDHGADLNAKNNNGDTPLHLAVTLIIGDSLPFCKYLLKRGANVTLKNDKGQTPLDLSIKEKKMKVSKCLIDYSGDVNEENDEGGTIVHKIVSRNQIELLDYLVSVKHADVNMARKKDQWTPLHCAAVWDFPEGCKYLIEHGANPRAKDNKGRIPAELASDKTTIDYLQNAVTEIRSRRSANPASFWIPPYLPKPENNAPRVTGNSYEGSTSAFSNEMQPFHIQSFLAVANFAIRYLCHSHTHTPMIGDIPPNGINHVAEEAIYSFIDFEEDEAN